MVDSILVVVDSILMVLINDRPDLVGLRPGEFKLGELRRGGF